MSTRVVVATAARCILRRGIVRDHQPGVVSVRASSSTCGMASSSSLSFCDVGVNLLDDMFAGTYHGKHRHEGDVEDVLARARATGVMEMVVTAGTLEEARACEEMCAKYKSMEAADARRRPRMFSTCGVHPTRCGAFKDDPRGADGHLESLMALAREGKARGTIVAIGELGLDYDRLEFCDAETQREMFEKQFALSQETGLPLFLHMRNAADDFMDVIERNRGKFTRGVVHSFTGTADEARRVLQCDGLYIGINGCSLKTQENLDVVRTIPLDRMMLETDAPWCGVKNSHAGISMTSAPDHWPPTVKKEKFVPGAMVKDRCEPAHVLFIAQIVAALKGVSVEEVAATTRRAALDVFGLDD